MSQNALPSMNSISFSNSCFNLDSTQECSPWEGTKFQSMIVGTIEINSTSQLDKYVSHFSNYSCQPYTKYYVCQLLSQNSNCGSRLCEKSCKLIRDNVESCDKTISNAFDSCPKENCDASPDFHNVTYLINPWIIILIVFCCLLPIFCALLGLRRRRQNQRLVNMKSEFSSFPKADLVLRNVPSFNYAQLSAKFSNVSLLSSKTSKNLETFNERNADLNNVNRTAMSVQTNKSYLSDEMYKRRFISSSTNDSAVQGGRSFTQLYRNSKKSLKSLIFSSNADINELEDNQNEGSVRLKPIETKLKYEDAFSSSKFESAINMIDRYKTGAHPSPLQDSPPK
eukprot:NODE_652_length_4999_cov_0.731020.p3 type:complete len:339 gc:universal NODE_652_length_4999_cov_0.731020:2472-1456(-)